MSGFPKSTVSGNALQVPVVTNILTAGSARIIDITGAKSAVVHMTLDQALCNITLAGFDGNNIWNDLTLYITTTAGRQYAFVTAVSPDDGNLPVQFSGSGDQVLFLYSLGDGTIRLSHGQRLKTLVVTVPGVVSVATPAPAPYTMKRDTRVVSVSLAAGTAPGSAIHKSQLYKNGAAMYTAGNQPSLGIGNTSNNAVALPDVAGAQLFAPNDVLKFGRTQVGGEADLEYVVELLQVV